MAALGMKVCGWAQYRHLHAQPHEQGWQQKQHKRRHHTVAVACCLQRLMLLLLLLQGSAALLLLCQLQLPLSGGPWSSCSCQH